MCVSRHDWPPNLRESHVPKRDQYLDNTILLDFYDSKMLVRLSGHTSTPPWG